MKTPSTEQIWEIRPRFCFRKDGSALMVYDPARRAHLLKSHHVAEAVARTERPKALGTAHSQCIRANAKTRESLTSEQRTFYSDQVTAETKAKSKLVGTYHMASKHIQ